MTAPVVAAPVLELDRVVLRYPGSSLPAVDGLSLTARRGEVITLLGPSGCGKTSALRLIAGLESADGGSILLDGQDISDWPPERRQMGFVFQNYALFPHLSVADNVGFGLKVRKTPKAEIEAAVDEALDLVKLRELRARRIDQLSGGQQQRIALARALAIKPRVLLLDEPLSNLDATLREQTREALKELLGSLDVTTFFVTHDQADAFAFSDRIVLMRSGHVIETGPPARLYNEPETIFAAEFLGAANVLDVVTLQPGNTVRYTGSDSASVFDAASWSERTRSLPPGASCAAIVRPERCRLGNEPGPNRIHGAVTDVTYLGPAFRVSVSVPGASQPVRVLTQVRPETSNVWVEFPADGLRIVLSEN